MHNCVTSHLWLKTALHASSHPCMCTCVFCRGCFLFTRSPSSTLFRCSPSGPSRCLPQSSTRGSSPTPCATSAWGPWPLLTTRHPSHVYEPKKDMNLVNTEELDLATTSNIYFQNALDDTASFPNDPDVDDNQLTKYLAVVVDSTGETC